MRIYTLKEVLLDRQRIQMGKTQTPEGDNLEAMKRRELMKKKVISFVLVFVTVFAMAAPAFAAPEPKPGDPMWDPKYAGATQLEAVPSARTNASGEKITSNAHSGDYPGLYFYWNDKQKEPGILLVREDVFSWYEDEQFIITAKNSNNYWDYLITKNESAIIDYDEDGLAIYAFGIPKQIQYINDKGKKATEDLKNINMIFIDGNWRTYEIEIVKVWLDTAGDETSRPGYAQATFTNGYSLGKKTIRLWTEDSATISFAENPVLRHKLVGVTVNGLDVDDHNNISFPASSEGKYRIVFTNQCTDANLVITKEWEDINFPGQIPSVSFTNGYQLGQRVVAAGTFVEFSEIELDDVIIDGYVYSFDLASITINGVPSDSVSFEAEENTVYEIVFTNTVTRTALPATVLIEKEWILVDLPEGAEWTRPDDLRATFTNGYILGENSVDGDSNVNFEEVVLNWSEDIEVGDFKYRLSFVLDYITLDGEVVGEIGFVAAADGSYTIVFYNRLVVTDITPDPYVIPPRIIVADKPIPSTTHFDRWWSYGVLCYSSNTTAEGDYFVAFADGFWDENEFVVIAFGNEGSYECVVTFRADGAYIDDQFIGGYDSYRITWDPHYTNGEGFLGLDLDGIWFANPYGSGSRQAWRLEIQPKATPDN